MFLLRFLVLLLAMGGFAYGQTPGQFPPGRPLPAAALNAMFAAKQDFPAPPSANPVIPGTTLCQGCTAPNLLNNTGSPNKIADSGIPATLLSQVSAFSTLCNATAGATLVQNCPAITAVAPLVISGNNLGVGSATNGAYAYFGDNTQFGGMFGYGHAIEINNMIIGAGGSPNGQFGVGESGISFSAPPATTVLVVADFAAAFAGVADSKNGSGTIAVAANFYIGATHTIGTTNYALYSLSTAPSSFAGVLSATGHVATAVAPTVSAGQIGYGSTVVAAGSGTCPTGTVGGATVAGCIVVNIAGTAKNVPYF